MCLITAATPMVNCMFDGCTIATRGSRCGQGGSEKGGARLSPNQPNQTKTVCTDDAVNLFDFQNKTPCACGSLPPLERPFDESKGKCSAGQNVKPFHVYLARNISPATCRQFLFGSILKAALKPMQRLSGDYKDGKKSSSLTQLWSFAESEEVGPEFGNGGVVEHVITHRGPEAGCSDHVQQVKSSPHRSYNTAA